jgi:hypothetical protein
VIIVDVRYAIVGMNVYRWGDPIGEDRKAVLNEVIRGRSDVEAAVGCYVESCSCRRQREEVQVHQAACNSSLMKKKHSA